MAVLAAALGFAHPAHADTPDAPDVSAVAAVSVPDPAAVASAAATATQAGATNISVSVRIGSPGDNGDVSQTVTVSTGATDQQNTASQAQTAQTAPTNVSVSVRIDSPGSNGAVAQATSAAADPAPSSSAQYQQPATQYPAPSASAAPAAPAAPPAQTPPPAPSPAPDPAPAQQITSAPSSWVWNLTVSGCGDTSAGDITKSIDTGIQGWIWNWNLGTICQGSPPIAPVNQPESGGGISPPSLPAPDPPTPPSIAAPQVLVLPPVPQPVITAPPVVAVVVPVLGPIELPTGLTPVVLQDPIALPQAPGLLSPIRPSHAHRHIRVASKTPLPDAGVLAAAVTLQAPRLADTAKQVRESRPAPHRSATHKAPPWESLSLILDSSFVPAPAGASAAGGGGGGAAGGAAAVLSLWFLLQLPGFAFLRLPARQRSPRGPVDKRQTRPG